jgi:hypothetical protein
MAARVVVAGSSAGRGSRSYAAEGDVQGAKEAYEKALDTEHPPMRHRWPGSSSEPCKRMTGAEQVRESKGAGTSKSRVGFGTKSDDKSA